MFKDLQYLIAEPEVSKSHLIYLASPYSHEDKMIEQHRYEIAEEVTAKALNMGFFVYSPIVHCHNLALKYNLPTDAKFWEKYNYELLLRSDYLVVLALNGWTKSKGVNWEINTANNLGKRIYYEEYDNATSTQK